MNKIASDHLVTFKILDVAWKQLQAFKDKNLLEEPKVHLIYDEFLNMEFNYNCDGNSISDTHCKQYLKDLIERSISKNRTVNIIVDQSQKSISIIPSFIDGIIKPNKIVGIKHTDIKVYISNQ